MKKTFVTLAMILVGLTTQLFAMSMSNIRSNARFLSDRMAYELDLTPMQYDDCYEINFDFIYSINNIMDDVIYGYGDAIENYYRLLDYRNEDLRFVLDARQYARFLSLDYFYRPIYSTGRSWAFRIHTIYSNRSFFYFDAPSIYRTYRGAHSRLHYHNDYYVHRHHHHEIHHAPAHIHGTPHFQEHGRRDFGTVRRERNDRHHNSINNYRNPNQHNRTQDHRYRDNSGNHNSPQINHRNESGARPQQGGRHEGAQQSRPQQGGRHEGAQQGGRHERGNNGGNTRSQGGDDRGGRNNGHGNHQGGGRSGRR